MSDAPQSLPMRTLLSTFLLLGLVGGIAASKAEAATVQIRNKTAMPITIALQGTGTTSYSTDKLQPGKARVYRVQSSSDTVYMWVMPPGSTKWIRFGAIKNPKQYSIHGYHRANLRVGGDVDRRFR